MRLNLIPHPDFASDKVDEISVDIGISQKGYLDFSYLVSGDVNSVAFLEDSPSKHTDYLWQHTCFEAFIQPSGAASYYEFNFSPSSEWAVYGFENHRKGMANVQLPKDPALVVLRNSNSFQLDVHLDLTNLLDVMGSESLYLGLSTIIEEKNGHKSLWALKHPDGDPDFHNNDCFVQTLHTADII